MIFKSELLILCILIMKIYTEKIWRKHLERVEQVLNMFMMYLHLPINI